MDKNNKPKHFLVLKIIGATLIILGVILLVCGFLTKVPKMGDEGWFEADTRKMMKIAGGVVCCMFSVPFFFLGFRPEITKMATKSTKYIQQETKEDLKDIVDTTADIAGGAITKTTRAIKEGLEDEKMFCKHCGAKIDADSKFCNKCGKEQ